MIINFSSTYQVLPTKLGVYITPAQGVLVESFITFLLCSVVLFVCVSPSQPKERKKMVIYFKVQNLNQYEGSFYCWSSNYS